MAGDVAPVEETIDVGISLAEWRERMSNPDIHREKLPCELNQLQIHARGVEIAKRMGDRDELELEKKATADQYNADIKIETDRIAALAREVRERRQYCEVEVKMVRVENTGMIQWIRQDTDEIVRERLMTEDERQLKLLDAPAEAPGEKAAGS